MRILIADDDAAIRIVLQRILEKAGYDAVRGLEIPLGARILIPTERDVT